MKTKSNNDIQKSVMTITIATLLLVGMIFGLNWLLTDQFQLNELEAQKKIPRMVLPEGDYFETYEGQTADRVSVCYVAANGAGIAVVVDQATTLGDIQVMVGINADGQITKVAVLAQEYTEGSDAGVAEADYLKVYIGRTVLSASVLSRDYEIDPVPGAEEASEAIYQAVKTALLQNVIIENVNDAANQKAAADGGN